MSDVHSGAGPCYIVDASGQAYIPVVAGPGCTAPPGSEPLGNFCFGYQSEQGWVSQPYIVGYSYAVMPTGNEGSNMVMVPVLQPDDSASLHAGGVHTTDNHQTPEVAAASPVPMPPPAPTGTDTGSTTPSVAPFDASFGTPTSAAASIVRGPQGGQGPCLWASPEHGVTPGPVWVVSDSQYTSMDTGVRQDPNINTAMPSTHRTRPEGSRRTSRADRRRRGQLRHLAAAAEQRALEAKQAAEEAERLAAERARKLTMMTQAAQLSTPTTQKTEEEIPKVVAAAPPMPVKTRASAQSSRSDECHSDSTEASAGPERECPAPKVVKEKAVVAKSKQEQPQVSGALAAHKAKVAWVPPPARVETPPERVTAKVLLRAYRAAGAALFPRQPKAKKGKKATEPKTKQAKQRKSAEAPEAAPAITEEAPRCDHAVEEETKDAAPAPVQHQEEPADPPADLRKEESKPQMHDLGDAISEAVLAELAQDLLDETESTLASSRGGFLAEDGTVCSEDAPSSEAGDGKSMDVMHSMMLGSALLSGSAPRLQLLLWQMSRH